MIKIRTLLLILIPAFIILALAMFVRILQFQSITPSEKEIEKWADAKNFTIPLYKEDPIIGNSRVGINIVIFEDFNCAACKVQNTLLKKLVNKYPDKVKIIWKGLSSAGFPYPTEMAHSYSYCANEQNKFIEFKDFAFVNSDNLSEDTLNLIIENIDINLNKFEKCLQSDSPAIHLQKNEIIAQALNIQNIPTAFINNKQIQIPSLLEGWETLLSL